MKPLALILSMGMLWCCQPTAPEKTFSPELVIEEVTEMLHQYHQAIEEGGLETEFDYLDDSDDFFWVPPGFKSALDYDSVAIILRANDKSIEKIVLTWDSLHVTPLRSDLAQYYGTINSSVIDTAQMTTESLLIETGLIIKRADGWKLLSGQSAFFPKE
ncbi:MAG: nuclear transport factor 2 family protein [Cyclobacteriaceae bacterium]|nr:nuclear transport factor 2 family protein [Cyclobacteriaceae bacterium]